MSDAFRSKIFFVIFNLSSIYSNLNIEWFWPGSIKNCRQKKGPENNILAKYKKNTDKYEKNRNLINSCYYGEMPYVMKKNLIIIKSIIVWKWNHLFMKNYFRKKKMNYWYGFMPGNFQVICGSLVGENHWLPTLTETPEFVESLKFWYWDVILIVNLRNVISPLESY